MFKTFIKRASNIFRIQAVNRNVSIVSQGKRGLQGIQGIQGEQGEQGDPATNIIQSVNGHTGIVVLTPDDLDDTSSFNKFVSVADLVSIASAIHPGDNISDLVNDAGFISDLSTFDTSDLTEGSNLYYTNARVDARIALQAGQINGLATLGADGKIPTSQLPALAITDTFVVASQAAMLALTAEVGDIAVRSDLNKTFILKTADPSILANWQELLTPTDTVLSVNGQTGAVTLTTSNIAEGSNLYYTDARVQTVGDIRYLEISDNLSDLNNVGTARTNLGLIAGGAGDIWVEKGGDTMTGNLLLNGGAVLTSSYLRVGSISAPSNVSAGDLTMARLRVVGPGGTDSAFSVSTGTAISISGVMTDASAGAKIFMGIAPIFTPTSNSSSEFRTLNFDSIANPATTITMGTLRSAVFRTKIRGDGLVTAVTGITLTGVDVDASSLATAAITTLTGLGVTPFTRSAGSTTTTITTATAFEASGGSNGGLTVTDYIGYAVKSPSGGTITNQYGLKIDSLNRATTELWGIQVAYPAIQGSQAGTTNLIGYGMPTASVVLGNTTGTTAMVAGIYLGIPTYTSTTNVRTVTKMANLYIEGAPVNSTNVTVTNGPYSVWVAGGTSRFDGNVIVTAPGTASGSVETIDGVQTVTNKDFSSPTNIPTPYVYRARKTFYAYDDFINNTNSSFFVSVSQNTGSLGLLTTDGAAQVGISTLTTSTNAAGGAGIWSSQTNFIDFTTATEWVFESKIQIPTLSVLAERFQVWIGFIDNSFTESTDGVYFSYKDDVNGGEWEGVTSSNGVRTRTDLNVAPVAGSWVVLKVKVLNVGGTLKARFYINDVQVGGDITADVPTGTARVCGYGNILLKTTGTTARLVYVDYMEVSGLFTANR